jgi:hypothetical protein
LALCVASSAKVVPAFPAPSTATVFPIDVFLCGMLWTKQPVNSMA